MSLGISISPASDTPIFRQIVQQIQRAVAQGRIRVGEQLPAVRILAETLLINPNTVARSYQELIRDGVLESRSGRGVFVAEKRQIFSESESERRLQHAAEQLCHEGMLLGAKLPEIREVLDNKWRELQPEQSSEEPPKERKKK